MDSKEDAPRTPDMVTRLQVPAHGLRQRGVKGGVEEDGVVQRESQ